MSAETAVPIFYGIFILASTALWPMVVRSRIRLASVAKASLVAGPVFAVCAAFPMPPIAMISHPDAMALLVVLAAVIIIGVLIALPANLLGSLAMIRIGDHVLLARRPLAWALVGGVAAPTPFLLSGLMAEDNAGLVFAFGITGACCALVCRRRVSWPEDRSSAISQGQEAV